MLYASTKATFKKEFGGGQLKEEYYANLQQEVTLAGYKRHLRAEQAPGPLSREEEEMLEIKQSEIRVEIGVDSKQAMANLQFPFNKSALNAISPSITFVPMVPRFLTDLMFLFPDYIRTQLSCCFGLAWHQFVCTCSFCGTKQYHLPFLAGGRGEGVTSVLVCICSL